jgi:hypothetical protein
VRVLRADGVPRHGLQDHRWRSANAKFIGEGLFKFHNDCGCTVAPAFQRGTKPDPIAQEAAGSTERTDEADAAAFRKAWNNRAR